MRVIQMLWTETFCWLSPSRNNRCLKELTRSPGSPDLSCLTTIAPPCGGFGHAVRAGRNQNGSRTLQPSASLEMSMSGKLNLVHHRKLTGLRTRLEVQAIIFLFKQHASRAQQAH